MSRADGSEGRRRGNEPPGRGVHVRSVDEVMPASKACVDAGPRMVVAEPHRQRSARDDD